MLQAKTKLVVNRSNQNDAGKNIRHVESVIQKIMLRTGTYARMKHEMKIAYNITMHLETYWEEDS